MTTSALLTLVSHQYHAGVERRNEADGAASERPLRLLHVAPYYEQARAYGGIPRVVSRLARGLVARGHRVTVCTTDACDAGRRALPTSPPASGLVEVAMFPNVSNALAYHLQLFLPIGLGRYLGPRAASYDLAHLHGCHNLPGVIAANKLRAVGVPYLVQPHGTAPLIERRRAAKWAFDRTVGRHVMTGAARVIAVSAAERRQLAALGVDEARVGMVPNPLDLDEHQAAISRGAFRQRWRLGTGPVVLYLGQLTPRKRVDVLIRAFSELAPAGGRLVVAGNDRGVEASLRALVGRLRLDDRVIFTGLLEGGQRLEALSDADVLVYPGEHEIFGLVPLEAILRETPVIVADDSGCGEVIRRIGGGLVARQGDVTAFAGALREVLSDGTRWRQQAARARLRAQELYAPDVVCADLERLYRDVIAGTRRQAGP